MPTPALHLLTKAPVAGQVKTRLLPHCSAEEAADIAAWCIEYTVRLAKSAWSGPINLHVWPGPQHPIFSTLCQSLDIELQVQAVGDLGAKMHAALETAYPGGVMGCDVPHCPPQALIDANLALREGRCVLGPSHDGGYYFLGLTRPQPALFEDMPWGLSSVYRTTLATAQRLGIDLFVLPELIDLDLWDDVERVRRQFRPLRDFLANRHPQLLAGPPR